MTYDKDRAKFAQSILKRMISLESTREGNYKRVESGEITEQQLQEENKFIVMEIEKLSTLYNESYISWEIL